MAKITYVMCRVSRGFWDSEYYVILGESAAFVSRENVKVERVPEQNAEVEGQVLASIVDQKADSFLVELPGEAVVGGLRNWVPRRSLAAT